MDLHKAVGLWTLAFNLLFGVTGAVLGLENLYYRMRPPVPRSPAMFAPAPPLADAAHARRRRGAGDGARRRASVRPRSRCRSRGRSSSAAITRASSSPRAPANTPCTAAPAWSRWSSTLAGRRGRSSSTTCSIRCTSATSASGWGWCRLRGRAAVGGRRPGPGDAGHHRRRDVARAAAAADGQPCRRPAPDAVAMSSAMERLK